MFFFLLWLTFFLSIPVSYGNESAFWMFILLACIAAPVACILRCHLYRFSMWAQRTCTCTPACIRAEEVILIALYVGTIIWAAVTVRLLAFAMNRNALTPHCCYFNLKRQPVHMSSSMPWMCFGRFGNACYWQHCFPILTLGVCIAGVAGHDWIGFTQPRLQVPVLLDLLPLLYPERRCVPWIYALGIRCGCKGQPTLDRTYGIELMMFSWMWNC